MSSHELNKIKLDLIGWINHLTDENLISILEGIRVSRLNGDWWDQLSREQREIILKGLQYADQGKLISSKEFWKKLTDA